MKIRSDMHEGMHRLTITPGIIEGQVSDAVLLSAAKAFDRGDERARERLVSNMLVAHMMTLHRAVRKKLEEMMKARLEEEK